MTEKELRHLSRKELLEILIDQTKEITSLRDTVQKLENELTERRIAIAESGSLAEASLKLNGLFADADKAAKQYLENAGLIEKEAREKADEIVAEAEKIKAQKIEEGNLYINKVKRIVSEYLEKQKRKKKTVGDEKREESQKNRSSAVGCSDAGNGVKTS